MQALRPTCCGSLFLSGFLVWQSAMHRKEKNMDAKRAGGAPATADGKDSPFGIYRNALDFVMNSLSLDEDAAAGVILNEMGAHADDWQRFVVRTAAGEIRAERLPPRILDWRLAWLN